ncbi:MAG: protein kinase [Myxococcota bacterium]
MGERRWCPDCNTWTEASRCPSCGAPSVVATESPDLFTGRTIAGKYQLHGVLGRGGMGVVYRAEDRNLKREVAVKLIATTRVPDTDIIKRFQQEARLSSRINHPNAITIYDSGVTDDGMMYLVMELLLGRELSVELERAGALEPQRAVAVAIQVLRALNAAHEAGIVHRDLKPANVFLREVKGEGEQVKVMDFGIAKVLHRGPGDAKVTTSGTVLGSPSYMSPEQAQGASVDQRSDLYSVGVILFEMLTGRLPHVADSPTGSMYAHIVEAPPRLAEVRASLAHAEALQRVLDRLLAKRPSDRPGSALECITLLQQTGVESLPGSLDVIPPRATVSSADEDTRPARKPRQTSPRPLVWAVPAFGVLVGGAVAAWPGGEDVRAPAPVITAVVPAPRVTASEPPPPIVTEAPALVTLRFNSLPDGAEVTLDGVALGRSPLTHSLPAAGKPLKVVFTKAGYKPMVLNVAPTESQTIQTALVPLPRPSAPPSQRKAPAPAPTVKSDAELLEHLD